MSSYPLVSVCVKVTYLAAAGVSAVQLSMVKDLGFAGAAVLGSVWQAADPLEAMHKLLAAAELA